MFRSHDVSPFRNVFIPTRLLDNNKMLKFLQSEKIISKPFAIFLCVVKSSTGEGYNPGLSITKWIIEAHKGSLSVESQPEPGTTAIIDLQD
jgi:light-regulated signal transduction histidine kinase (bacteriophytochrome)